MRFLHLADRHGQAPYPPTLSPVATSIRAGPGRTQKARCRVEVSGAGRTARWRWRQDGRFGGRSLHWFIVRLQTMGRRRHAVREAGSDMRHAASEAHLPESACAVYRPALAKIAEKPDPVAMLGAVCRLVTCRQLASGMQGTVPICRARGCPSRSQPAGSTTSFDAQALRSRPAMPPVTPVVVAATGRLPRVNRRDARRGRPLLPLASGRGGSHERS